MTSSTPTARVVRTTAEYATDRTTVATPAPRLSWVVESPTGGWRQSAAEVELTTSAGATTVRLEGGESVLVDWPFDLVGPGSEQSVRVRVVGAEGETSGWGEPLPVHAGFLAEGAWSARMVGLAEPERPAQPVLLRHEFTVGKPVRRARLYATAHGVYQVVVNGHEVDDEVLKPGWTAYQWRLLHETTDVTGLLVEGDNAIGVRLAGGWYCERYGFRGGARRIYGDQPAAALQLVVDYEDGESRTIASGDGWRASGAGPTVDSGIYLGERYDARRAADGWSAPGFDDAGWSPVRVDGDFPLPEARLSPGARRVATLPVTEVLRSPGGATILDFGQNLVGWVRLTVRGEPGTTVTLRHAEVLEHGELGTRPLRAAEATDTYTLAGTGTETWEPWSTFHGFRYVQVDGWPGDLDPADLVAVVTSSDMRRTGDFDCSEPQVNRLHENVVWSTRGNFLHVPTDCPQRDERLGWTGDIQVFAPTATDLFDCDGFLASWLRDLALEQDAADGVVPFVVPHVLGRAVPAAAWGDAATVVPWVLHERYGDRRVLQAQYPSMRSWADTILAIAGERRLWERRFQFGDWLDPTAPPERPEEARTDPDVVASAHLFRSTDLVARTAEMLGHADDAARYGRLAEEVRDAFLHEYLTPAGRLLSDSQTGYAMALVYGIVTDPSTRQTMGDRLADLVRAAAYRVGTGFVGTPIVCDALTSTGHADVAGRLLLQTENPSWLYPVTMGATTIWERWDSMLEDGSINPGQMTSFNHYAFGAIVDWLHRSVAGLASAAPGYREMTVAPHPIAGLEFARVSHETPYGRAAAGWERTGDGVLTVTAEIPANTMATVHLPGAAEPVRVGSGSHRWDVEAPVPTVSAGPVSLETELSHVVDDPEAYRTLMDVLAGHGATTAREFLAGTAWVRGMPLLDAMRRVPGAVQSDIAAAFDELNRSRSGSAGR